MSDEGNTMEPFTPTTEQVRAAYVRASRQAFIAATSEHEAEFDRWLAKREAQAVERARSEWERDFLSRVTADARVVGRRSTPTA